jgi:polar amino acid transport system permease protein
MVLRSNIKKVTNAFIASLLVIVLIWISVLRLGVSFDFSFVVEYRSRIWQGFRMTVLLSLLGFVLSLFIGVVAALFQNGKVLFLKYISIIYINFIRGTPLIMQIYLFYYIIGTAWGVENRFVSGVLILSIFEGAYIAEIIRGGIQGLESTQLEAAKAVGFSKNQTIRLVIIPQLVARTLPPLVGQFSSIIKDSSLLSIIAVIELTQSIRELSALNFRLFESYLFLGVLYLCLTIPLALIGKVLEKHYNFEA